MPYPIETYLQIRDCVELERRFKNLEPLVRVKMQEMNALVKTLADPEYGRVLVDQLECELEDLKIDMTNIAHAIEILQQGVPG